MADDNGSSSDLPNHIDHTIRSIAIIHAEHSQNATSAQLAVDRITAVVGRPWFIGALTAIVTSWIGLNLFALTLGHRPLDPSPFPWLGGAVSLVSLYMVVLVLVTQRHEDRLSQHREQLILDLVVLSEQKAAKVIQLLEEFRRDNPLIHNRVDQEANDMAQPANTLSVSDAIREVHVQADQTMGRCVNSDLSGPSMGRHRGFNNNE